MNQESSPRFDPDALEDRAGDRVFARGEAYFRGGKVDILAIEPSEVVARVAGTETYQTIVTGRDTAIGGGCSCPAYAREGFCKHMVAVALAVNAGATAGAAGGALGAGGGDKRTQIRDYLKTKDIAALVDMIMELAEQDPVLFGKLEVSAALLNADDETLSSHLRTAIREATRTRGFVDYAHAPRWAARVDAALDTLDETASGPRGALAVELASYAISRIESAIEDIDDSDGRCGMLLAHARRIHLDACRAARPDPVALARDLFQRETEDEYGTFHAAVAQYADILGEDGLAEYRRLAQEAWDKLPARIGPSRGTEDYLYDHLRLEPILDFFAERDGDVEARIALRAKNLSSPWNYLELGKFCAEHGREAEALRRAEDGLWVFEDDRPDERLVYFTVDLLLKAKRKADAEAHLWRAFEKEPSLGLYARLRKLGGEAAAKRAVGFLRRELADTSSKRWYSGADLIVGVMIEEKMFDDAWAIARDHEISRYVTEALAKASEATHAREALAVYAERVEELARAGGNPAYEEAAKLIARIATLQDAAEQAAYLAALKERHGRKRNLMKLLG